MNLKYYSYICVVLTNKTKKYERKTKFQGRQKEELEGVIYVVDAYGTFFEPDDVSYDIIESHEGALYKHIQEKYVSEIKND